MNNNLDLYQQIRKNNHTTHLVEFTWVILTLVFSNIITYLAYIVLTLFSTALNPASHPHFLAFQILESCMLMIMISIYMYHRIKNATNIAIKDVNGKVITDTITYPVVFTLINNMSIAAGIPQPKLFIINDLSLNATSVGTKPQDTAIGLTKGLVNTLTQNELEGVIAHEISHIKFHDTEVFTIGNALQSVFLKVAHFGLMCICLYKPKERKYGRSPQTQQLGKLYGYTNPANNPSNIIANLDNNSLNVSTSSNYTNTEYMGDDDLDDGLAGMPSGSSSSRSPILSLYLMLRIPLWFLFGIIVEFISWPAYFIAYMLQMFVIKNREYLADAESVNFTRNPYGLIYALWKISRRPNLMPENLASDELFICNPHKPKGLYKLFNCHPLVNKRIYRLESMM